MISYVGNGPYCYANSLAMMLGSGTPPVIEVLTGSPYGFELVDGRLPYFNPAGWDPLIGLDDALALLGWRGRRLSATDDASALAMLRETLAAGPALAGPVEFGLLRHLPGMTGPIEADHYVVVLAVDDESVLFHDPHGCPYATRPVADFLAAWRGDTIPYPASPYSLLCDLRRVDDVGVEEAVRASLPRAAAWLRGSATDGEPSVPSAVAVHRFADMVESGLEPQVRGLLADFSVRVGARRLADTADVLGGLGLVRAAAVATGQARLIGSLQHCVVAGSPSAAAAALRRLAPTYEELADALP